VLGCDLKGPAQVGGVGSGGEKDGGVGVGAVDVVAGAVGDLRQRCDRARGEMEGLLRLCQRARLLQQGLLFLCDKTPRGDSGYRSRRKVSSEKCCE